MPPSSGKPSLAETGSLLVCAAILSLLVAAGCAGGRVPILEPPRAVAGSVLVMSPEIRMGVGGNESSELLKDPLAAQLRQAIAGRGLSIARAPDAQVERFRKAVQAHWAKQRAGGSRRFKSGEDLGLRELLSAPASSGARVAVFVVLARTGASRGGEWAAVPQDEMIPLPQERPDYVIPKTGSQSISRGVELDLLMVDLHTSQVVLHRRVSHPASDLGEIIAVLPVLTREVTRGLTP